MTDYLYEIIEIHDSEIDVEEIMRKIRADARRLRKELGDGADWPSYGTIPPSTSADEDLHEHLRRAFATYDKLYVEMILTRRNRFSSFAPLAAIRRAFHGLVLFYVNTLASKQTLFNAQAVHTLSRLAEELESRESQVDVDALHDRIRQLEKRITDLEARLSAR